MGLLTSGILNVGDGFAFDVEGPGITGAVFLAGLVVYFARYWATVLSFVGAVFPGGIVVVWLLAGLPGGTVVLLDPAMQVAFVVPSAYLVVADLRGEDPEGETEVEEQSTG